MKITLYLEYDIIVRPLFIILVKSRQNVSR